MQKIKILKHFINKALVFINPDNANYWHTITLCNIKEKPNELGKYYLDFSSKAYYPESFSNDGIPLYSYFDEPPIEHPIVIAQYALGLFELYFRNELSKEQEESLKRQIQWFINNREEYLDGYIWRVNYKIAEYGLNEPWFSALAQGEAISVLTRAAKFLNISEAAETAGKAITPFEFDVDDGGLVNYFKGYKIYEEYPSPIKTVGVLNGFMFSLFGLYDLYLLNNNDRAKKLFDEGISSLLSLLDYYDFGYWARYYLFDYPNKYAASLTYLLLMKEQLKVLYILTGEQKFKEFANKWENYAGSRINKTRALLRKVFYARKLSK